MHMLSRRRSGEPGPRKYKVNVLLTDTAYRSLIQSAHELGYVRGPKDDDRPRGLSKYVSVLATYPPDNWEDTRPDWAKGTSQWYAATEHTKQRCMHLTDQIIAGFGFVALEYGIWPFKSQLPVVNGWRQIVEPPVLRSTVGAPKGATTVKALVSPVLEAIGTGWLTLKHPLPVAPPDLYSGPSNRYSLRARKRALERSLEL